MSSFTLAHWLLVLLFPLSVMGGLFDGIRRLWHRVAGARRATAPRCRTPGWLLVTHAMTLFAAAGAYAAGRDHEFAKLLEALGTVILLYAVLRKSPAQFPGQPPTPPGQGQ